MADANTEKKTAKAMYEEMAQQREPYLRRAREASTYTIPSLIPPDGKRDQDLPTPWQAIGAMGTNNISSKVVMAIIPPNTPFFRLDMNQQTQAAVEQAGASGDIGQIMSKFETSIMKEVEDRADRVSIFEGVKHLVVGGNVLLHTPASGSARVYSLDQYVVKRTPGGQTIRIIVKEAVSPLALPDNIKAAAVAEIEKHKNIANLIDIYTVIERSPEDNGYITWQEVCGEPVEGTEGVYRDESLAWLPLRWHRIAGEDYGRGFIEEYMGDLQALEGLSKAVVEGAAASAKIVFLRNPSATVKAEDFTNAENGDVIDGMPTDFHIVQADKFADMRVALESIQRIESRLAKAFLMVSSVQRDAERVTAEEIRTLATDLEDALGGIYSTLTLEFQLPYIKRRIAIMQQQGRLPQFPKGSVTPTITTGIAALGRNHEVMKIMSWARACAAVIGPEAFAATVNADELLKTFATGFNVEAAKIVKSQQQMQAEREAAQRQQTLQTMGPEIIRAKAASQSAQ